MGWWSSNKFYCEQAGSLVRRKRKKGRRARGGGKGGVSPRALARPFILSPTEEPIHRFKKKKQNKVLRKMLLQFIMSVEQIKIFESPTGFDSMTFRTPVGCSNHWATNRETRGELVNYYRVPFGLSYKGRQGLFCVLNKIISFSLTQERENKQENKLWDWRLNRLEHINREWK